MRDARHQSAWGQPVHELCMNLWISPVPIPASVVV